MESGGGGLDPRRRDGRPFRAQPHHGADDRGGRSQGDGAPDRRPPDDRQPRRVHREFAAAGATHISVHAESVVHLNRSLQLVRSCGAHPGIALGPAAPLSLLDWSLDYRRLRAPARREPRLRRPGVPARGAEQDPRAARGARPARSLHDRSNPTAASTRGQSRISPRPGSTPSCRLRDFSEARTTRPPLPGMRSEVERGTKGRAAPMIAIKNGFWGARISETGRRAEESLLDLFTGQEHIWHGGPGLVGRVGTGALPRHRRPEGRRVHLRGEARTSCRHTALPGRASSPWPAQAKTRAELTLASSPQTREVYPFDFRLKVSFQLGAPGSPSVTT